MSKIKDPAERFRIVVEGWKRAECRTDVDLCKKYGISRTTLFKWRRAIDRIAPHALSTGGPWSKIKRLEEQVKRLKERLDHLESPNSAAVDDRKPRRRMSRIEREERILAQDDELEEG
jgi:transposase-like protein